MSNDIFKLKELEKLVGHLFNDPDVLRQALTHASLERSSSVSYTHLTLPTILLV